VIAYFIFFYLLPEYNEALAIFGFIIIYAYICIGSFFFGYFIGKFVVRHNNSINIFQCLLYSLFSFSLMLLVGSLGCIFFDCMYGSTTLTFSYFIRSLNDSEGLYVSIVTFASFLLGEFVEYVKIRFNKNNKQGDE
ncbi:MAG: hypothetical protein K2J99_17560, partial [Lachnospiraceae bacterium]|nr:hypothetical protein [Lachnospiraceae bacterium]